MLRQWLAALFGTFFSFTVLYNFAPVVVADYLDSGSVHTVETFETEKADCKYYLYVITHCSVHLRDKNDPKAEAVSLSHIYVGRVGDKPFVPVALGAESPRLSVKAGIENLGGRIMVMMLTGLVAFASLMGCAHMADARN